MKQPTGLRKWAKRFSLGAFGLTTLTVLGGALYQLATTRKLERENPAPGQLIDIGGHRLHLHRQGSGSPTVIIDAGLSGASYDWEPVAARIAAFTTVCTYDRAGYGWSDPGPRPRTSQRAMAELHALLQAAKINPPYILVAHSWAGLNARLYASQYADELVALVLVDALNTDLLPADPHLFKPSALFGFLDATAWCGSTWLAMPNFVLEPSDDPRALKLRQNMLARRQSAHAIYDELAGQANWLDVRSALKPLGSLPVTVISRRIQENTSTNAAPLNDQNWLRGQRALPGISTRSTFITASTYFHDIQFHEPQTIIDAVRHTVEMARQKSAEPR